MKKYFKLFSFIVVALIILFSAGIVKADIISVNLFKKSDSTSVVPINSYAIGTTTNPVNIVANNLTVTGSSTGITLSGGLLATNNLSDVSSTTAALGNILPTQSSSTANHFLTSDGTTASWEAIPSSGELVYYMNFATSSVTGYKQMITTPTSTQNTVASSTVGTGGYIASFITATSVPNVSFIPAGQFEVHIHADKTGTGNPSIFGELWEVTATGTHVALIGTSEISAGLTTSETEYRLSFSTANVYTMATTSSRLALHIVKSGAGTQTITLYLGGQSDSHLSLPMNLVGSSNLVPYVGATQNVDLGTNSLTANAMTVGTTISIDGTPNTDLTASGRVTNAFNSGYTSSTTDLVIMATTTGTFLPTDANNIASSTTFMAIALEAKTAGQTLNVALPGTFVRNDAWNWTAGQTLYVSETSATITATQPVTADAVIRVVGFAVTPDVIFFNPSSDYITHT